jgi:glycosyltransferase involved in cell wall biosynthesis
MNIAFLTSEDPRDRRSFSGTHYYMAKALAQYCGKVTLLGPVNPYQIFLGKVLNKVSRLLFNTAYIYEFNVSLARKYARIFQKKLSAGQFDVIFASRATAEIAFLEAGPPIVFLHDSTVALRVRHFSIIGQHPHFSPRAWREANLLESLAISKSRLAVYSSQWAARSAIQDYHADPGKVHVIPFGANLDETPSREAILAKKQADRCRMLFLGVEWDRKGGDIAFETLAQLDELKLPAQLTVCGCVPPKKYTHQNLKVIPFLNKNIPAQRAQLHELLLASDFLLLPTRADSFGIVFCEAAAYGLPAITADTGGVPEVVKSGENGYVLPHGAVAADYARVIYEIFSEKKRYDELASRSRAAYEDRLNWDAWGRKVRQLFDKIS